MKKSGDEGWKVLTSRLTSFQDSSSKKKQLHASRGFSGPFVEHEFHNIPGPSSMYLLPSYSLSACCYFFFVHLVFGTPGHLLVPGTSARAYSIQNLFHVSSSPFCKMTTQISKWPLINSHLLIVSSHLPLKTDMRVHPSFLFSRCAMITNCSQSHNSHPSHQWPHN